MLLGIMVMFFDGNYDIGILYVGWVDEMGYMVCIVEVFRDNGLC